MAKFLLGRLDKENLSSPVLFAVEYTESGLNNINELASRLKPWQLILLSSLTTYSVCRFYYFYADLDEGLLAHFKKEIFKLARKIPFLNKKIMSELEKTSYGLESDIIKSNKGSLFLKSLPEKGLDDTDLFEKVNTYLNLDPVKLRSGLLSGCVYNANDKLTELNTKVYEKFAWSNPLHADVFPGVRKMEAEVIRWVCNLFNGDADTCGSMSSGGTESIMLACLSYRNLAYSKGIKHPNMVIPVTAHAAFYKASQYFKIRLITVPVDPVTQRVDPNKLKSYINSSTCMIVGSAPQFAHGVIDPIEELSKIAVKYKIPLHVDACLGGFLIIFMERANYKIPLFDFRLPGVTSISCDTHKYGYAPKGSSVLLYRNKEYRKFQYSSVVEWPGGIYCSPTFAGSRPGSLIAMTWATLISIGLDGYVEYTKSIIQTTRHIANELKKIKEINLMCEPDVSVVAFDSKEFNIFNLLDEMSTKGWSLNGLQNPPGIHISITEVHTQPGIAEKFIDDMKSSVKAIMNRDDRKLGKMAAIYCTTQSIPDKSLVADVAYLYLDACYSTNDNLPTIKS